MLGWALHRERSSGRGVGDGPWIPLGGGGSACDMKEPTVCILLGPVLEFWLAAVSAVTRQRPLLYHTTKDANAFQYQNLT